MTYETKPGGYFMPIEDVKEPCTSPYHNPPSHLYVPPGQQFVHTCPCCGATSCLRSPLIRF